MSIRAIATRTTLSALLLAAACPAFAETFEDDFSGGLTPANWIVQKSADLPAYLVDVVSGSVFARKSVDATHSGEQAVWVTFAHPVVGNFTAEVQYHNAFVHRAGTGAGNDLALRARFRGQDYLVRRASESGTPAECYDVWADPPGFGYGRVATNVNAGTLRIVRQSLLVSMTADGTTLFTGVAPGDTLESIAFGLENHGTTDSTSVTFDDFVFTADQILWGVPVGAVGEGAGPGWSLGVTPNPVRGSASVALELPRAAEGRVSVVDVQGRTIALLHAGALGAGRHAFTWTPPAAVAPGLYFVRAEIPGHALRTRLALTH